MMRLSALDLESKVKQCYPKCTIKEIMEIFIPNQGWIKHQVIFSKIELNRIHKMKAEKVNLFLFDEFGMKRYPDYSILS